VKQNSLKGWFKSGAPGVWISGGAVSIAVIMTIGLLAVIAVRGLGHFWPADLIHASYDVPGQGNHLVVGEVVQKEEVPRARLKSAGLPVPDQGPEFMTRELIKVGNRDLNGNDFTWIVGDWLTQQTPRVGQLLRLPGQRQRGRQGRRRRRSGVAGTASADRSGEPARRPAQDP